IVLLIAGSAYAAINLTTGSPPEHNSLTPGINLAQGEKGLIGWWKLNGNTKDATPYQNNGTLSNPAPTPTTDRMGTANGAYSFDGIKNSIRLPDTSTNFSVGIGQTLTVSLWMKASTLSANGEMFWHQDGCIGWDVGATTAGAITLTDITGNSGCTGYHTYRVSTSGTNYTDNNWHLVTGVINRPAGTITLYIDGTQKASGSIDNTNNSTQTGADFFLGTSYANNNPFAGSLSDARIYNRALSQADITNLYNSYNSRVNLYSPPGSGGSVNLTNGLVGYWPFNGNAKDATPYSHNGTVSGATLTTNRFGSLNSAYSLNGTSDNISLTAAAMPSSAITVAAWVYMPTITPGHNFTRFLNNNWVSTSGTWLLYVNNTGAAPFAEFGITNPGTTQNNSRCANGSFTAGSWHFLAGTYDGSTIKLYQDGAACPITVSTSGAVLNTTGTVAIAASAGSGADPYSISQVRIYNRALSAAEVQALYNLPD
ncbi:MAG TPA: LamG domain-containing protein, partial [Candidatus Saccharimonadales bacterium]|nr:LamG domain-containing protein [Candidatus Saccharimonadales bacterium]